MYTERMRRGEQNNRKTPNEGRGRKEDGRDLLGSHPSSVPDN